VEYYDDKSDPENYVYIGVDIKGLKKKLFGSSAENADITFDRTDRYVLIILLVFFVLLSVSKTIGAVILNCMSLFYIYIYISLFHHKW